MSYSILVVLAVLAVLLSSTLAQERRRGRSCQKECNDLRFEVLTMEICREAKKVLPRPKVGEYCTTAMEQGFQDVCLSLCQGDKPINEVAKACKNAAMEMPRPTVRRWCEHGYSLAYEKTQKDLRTHFLQKEVSQNEPVVEEAAKAPVKEVLLTIPVTIEDKVLDLVIFKDTNAEESVAIFCRENVAEDVPACIRQLLPIAIEKIESIPAESV